MLRKTILILTVASLLCFVIGTQVGCQGDESSSKTETQDIVVTEEIPSLNEQLAAKKAKFIENAPPEFVKVIVSGTTELKESGIIAGIKQVGDMAPDFELPNAVGGATKLSNLLRQGPVVLIWYRGNW